LVIDERDEPVERFPAAALPVSQELGDLWRRFGGILGHVACMGRGRFCHSGRGASKSTSTCPSVLGAGSRLGWSHNARFADTAMSDPFSTTRWSLILASGTADTTN